MIGKIISHYRILEELGRGGMGVVYKARDTKLDRMVAIKFLPSHLSSDQEAKQRFIQEAKAASALDHPNICTIHEIDETEPSPGETGDGQLFIVMSYYEGETIKEKIQRGSLDIQETVDIIGQIAKGLAKAHEKGIVHRDIKPANIFITSDDVAKILDFGLVKLTDQTSMTKTDTPVGTTIYMSPEQARGEKVDSRTDVWALGVVFYEMITGQFPFKGEYEQAIIYSILNEEPALVSECDPSLSADYDDIVSRCLQKNPDNRYQTVEAFLIDLKQVKSGDDRTIKQKREFFRNKITYAIGIISILVLLLVFFNPFWQEKVPDQKHLAILPFKLVSNDPDQKALCEGLVETLTSKITQMNQFEEDLWVIPSSEISYLEEPNVRTVHREFGVNLAVTGSLQFMKNNMRLTINLVDAKNLRQLSSRVIGEEKMDSIELQDNVVAELARMIDLELNPEMRKTLAIGGTTEPKANEYYLQARGYMRRYENEENIDRAIHLLRNAIRLDTTFAMAYAGLGEAYLHKYELTKEMQLITEAQIQCKHALDINEELIPVRLLMGIMYQASGQYIQAIKVFKNILRLDPSHYHATVELALAYDDNEMLDKAETTYKRAIELRPGYWDAYNGLGHFYWRLGKLKKAEEMFRKVIELTPDNIRGYNNLGAIYHWQNQWEMAEEMFQKSIAIRPNADAYSNYGTLEFFKENYKNAISLYEEAVTFKKNDYVYWGNLADAYRYVPEYGEKAETVYRRAILLVNQQLDVNPKKSHLRASLAIYHAKLGEKESAMTELSMARNQSPDDVVILKKSVLVYELVGQRDQAMKALEEFIKKGGSPDQISIDPDLKGLRNDPRYTHVIQKK